MDFSEAFKTIFLLKKQYRNTLALIRKESDLISFLKKIGVKISENNIKIFKAVIPTIFNSRGLSIIVNDPKPELCYSTTGARAKEGPVFVINWGAEDNPAEGIYYPSWNPLSPNALPMPGPDRDM